jgi:hypothetical protein
LCAFDDPERIHSYHQVVYQLARDFDAAVICAAHPRKNSGAKPDKITLEGDSEAFFESIMGSSHFINSTGSLWGLERNREKNTTLFVGGRQRGNGEEHAIHYTLATAHRTTFHVFSISADNWTLYWSSNRPGGRTP